jgi:hypothetical protein
MSVKGNGGRRNFLRVAGGATIGGLAGLSGLDRSFAGFNARAAELFFRDRPVPRIAVLFEPPFTGVDDFGLTRETLAAALADGAPEFLSAADLAAKLPAGGFTLLVNPYGSAFPVECWEAVVKYLGTGGSFLNLGGVPFSVPVRREGTGWKQEVFQASYYKALGITETFTVPVNAGAEVRDIRRNGTDAGLAGTFTAATVHELYLRFTSTRDYPLEDGTSGQRDASVTPLAGVFTAAGDMIAAPVVLIDRMLGEFAGGRWVLAAFNGTITADGIRRLVRAALPAPRSASVVPTFATYYPGEVPAFRLSVDDREGSDGANEGDEWKITISGDDGKFSHDVTLSGDPLRKVYGSAWVLPASVARNLRPGPYTVDARFRPQDTAGKTGRPVEPVTCRNAFWIYDATVMASGKPITVRENSFYRGGDPFPVTGTSYMSGGVQRKFLFEPNPATWEDDFREMRDAGINMVRTGIWTGWKNVMLDVGSVSEYPLRSLDAFILTAQRHGVPVIFTFFAFLPEAWGGVNPYLDPRSVHAQKVFLRTIAARYRGCPGVIWDLINEPSFSSPTQLWYARPNYDKYEEAAWKEWILSQASAQASGQAPAQAQPQTPQQASSSTEAASLAILRERYRLTAGEEPSLPPLEEFRDVNLVGTKRLLRVGDYRLFAQEMFRRWTAEMVSALREGGGTVQLVTVGQDEGGTYERPGPHFFAPEVDFTSMHNWWYNDDLLWDSLVTTVPGKPNLIEETGVMFYEKADGRPWRSEEETRNLLERKLAITFAAGGAGFINWLWNTNQYMDSDNEAGIGLKRPDGSLKPEFDAVRQYSKFFGAQSRHLGESAPEPAVLVIPHTNLFSTRDSATEATKMAVRAAEYHCRIPLRTVSEYSPERAGPAPALLIFPSPAMIDAACWEKLMAFVAAGSTLLITGPFDNDRYLMPSRRSEALGVKGTAVTVGAEEHIIIDGKEYRVGFRGGKMQKIEKFVVEGTATSAVLTIAAGKGTVLWSPLPVECGDSIEAVAALYRFAAACAGVSSPVSVETHDPSVLVRPVAYRDAVMVVFVSDAGEPRTITGSMTGSGTPFTVEVPARRTLVRLHDLKGALIAELNPSRTGAF